MFYLSGIIISIFLVFLLIGKKDKNQADKILAIWLFFTGFHLSLFYLIFSNNFIKYPYFLGMEIPLPLIHGPFLYFYICSLTNQIKEFKKIFVHFIPPFLIFISLLPFFSLSLNEKIIIYQKEGFGYKNQMTLIYLLIILSGIIYIFLSLKKLKQHKKNITEQFSTTEQINLVWLQYLIWGTSVIWIIIVLGENKYIFVSVTCYILFLGYFGIKQVGIFTHIPQLKNEKDTKIQTHQSIQKSINETNTDKIKYEKSGLNTSTIEIIHSQLTKLILEEKVYKNSELTLVSLAEQLNIHSNSLSQVINSMENNNFYDFINSKRVNEFKEIVILPENQKFTLLSLAYNCGFNSKTSFNRHFKKHTGFSPTEYLRQINVKLK